MKESFSLLNPSHWMRDLKWRRIKNALSRIKLVVLDVDGVLTDGGLWFDNGGAVHKRFDVRDGLGIRLLQQEGFGLAFLSGGAGGATEARAKQLGIEHCLIGIKDKLAAVLMLQRQLGVTPLQSAFLGDDLNDLAVRPSVGLLLATSDACEPLRRKSDAVLHCSGGHGAVRELAERLLRSRSKKRWDKLCLNGWIDRND